MIANIPSPRAGWPPMAAAASIRTPMSNPKAGILHLAPIVVVSMEQLLHPRTEEAGQCDRQRQRRQVPSRLDGVDRLPGHAHRRRQVLLPKALRRSQDPHVVSHRWKVTLTSPLVSRVLYTPVAPRRRADFLLGRSAGEAYGGRPLRDVPVTPGRIAQHASLKEVQ